MWLKISGCRDADAVRDMLKCDVLTAVRIVLFSAKMAESEVTALAGPWTAGYCSLSSTHEAPKETSCQ